MCNGRLVLPKDDSFVQMALQGHDSKVGGHGGFLKAYQRVDLLERYEEGYQGICLNLPAT